MTKAGGSGGPRVAYVLLTAEEVYVKYLNTRIAWRAHLSQEILMATAKVLELNTFYFLSCIPLSKLRLKVVNIPRAIQQSRF